MPEEKCGNCKFFSDARCRRFPPVLYAYPDRPPYFEYHIYYTDFRYPDTSIIQWCGEWKSDGHEG